MPVSAWPARSRSSASSPNLTAFENVRIAVQAADRRWFGLWHDAHADEAANLRVWSLLDAVGLADRAGEICSALSHGEKRLLEIAVSLATRAKLLLLDEPLAGLAESDRKIVGDLISRLARTHSVFLIEHDIDRVLAMSDRITVLHQGRLIADGKPAEVARNPEVVSAYLGTAHGAAQTAPAEPVRLAPPREKPVGAPLLEISGVGAGYGGGTVLDGLDLVVHSAEVVALLGRNGRRQDDGAAHHHRRAAGCDRADHLRRRRHHPPASRRDQPARRLAGAGGSAALPEPHGDGDLKLASRPGGASLEEIYDLFPRVSQRLRSLGEHLSGGERQMVAIARASSCRAG